ncbi:MAG: glycosyltransferase family 4 protein [Eubacterium sp.]|nr:glycosyltransferase family 4 protein [Eubacterium sp.]
MIRSLLKAADAAKPVLVKIIPRSLLQRWKKRIAEVHFQTISKKRIPFEAGHDEKGVNIIGNIKLEAGLGKSCRIVASVLDQAGIPLDIFQYALPGADNIGDCTWDHRISDKLHYQINLIHINPTELTEAFAAIPPSTWDYRYQIAYWLWELEEVPDTWLPFFQCADEIWAPSEFVCKAIRKKTSLPVKHMPYYAQAQIQKEYGREHFGLKEGQFLFLVMYDSYSCVERKNPQAVFRAFREAFAKENQDVGLVIKIGHPGQKDEAWITDILEGYTNLYLIRDLLGNDEVNSLIRCVDAVVSLHRAEGFGLVLAEAMLLGTPVIATNWSANTEFMDADTACMVDYQLVTIEEDIPPFPAGGRWAEPDLRQAAGYMRKLYTDRQFCKELAQRAKVHVKQVLSMERAKKRMLDRLEEIWLELDHK